MKGLGSSGQGFGLRSTGMSKGNLAVYGGGRGLRVEGLQGLGTGFGS